MAAGHIARPGTQWGPCANEECMHTDCDASRRRARALCRICSEPIGYDVGYFEVHEDAGDAFLGYEHALCSYKRLES